MNLEDRVPLVLYDNQCYLCLKFARFIRFFSKSKISFVGHYSSLGQEIRSILGAEALEMFWFIDGKMAYGGRAALFPLFKAIISLGEKKFPNDTIHEECDEDCKTAKAVFLRSTSLFSNSRKIRINQSQ